MQKKIINKCITIIKSNKDYDKETLEKIEYGLSGLYLTITKLIVIIILALILNILKQTLIFLLIFNIIRLTSFGIHAKKSWQCLVSSVLIFIGIPLLISKFTLNIYLKIILGTINIILIFAFSPADTKKRPIVNKKRRRKYKIISTCTATIFVILSLIIKNSFINNSFVFALIIQNILISPITYKLYKEPYNNYIEFLKKYPEFA